MTCKTSSHPLLNWSYVKRYLFNPTYCHGDQYIRNLSNVTFSIICQLKSSAVGWASFVTNWNNTVSLIRKKTHSAASSLVCEHWRIQGGGVRDARPPLGVQILSISCSFWENLACSRPPWRVHAPPSGKSWIRHWWRLLLGSPEAISNNT